MLVNLAHKFWYLGPVAVQPSVLEKAQVPGGLLIDGDLSSA